jgi:CBS domain-containing protein
MGFRGVYDYAAGKKSWGSYRLPREGTNVPERTAGDVAHRDVPTCGLDEPLADVRERVRAAGWDTCIVVNEERVVLGRLGRKAVAGSGDESVEKAMSPGPSTVRPSIGADALLERIRTRNLSSYLLTTPDGRLVGLVRRSELEDGP